MSDGTKHFLEGAEEQTLERFVAIYNDAGDYLHVPNPFDIETMVDFQHQLERSRERLKVELEYLKKVLWNHAKIGLEFDSATDLPRQPADPDNAWIIHFGKPQEDKIWMALAKAKAD
jgi:hypothetical protein